MADLQQIVWGQRAVQWERAKGELRAMVALMGAVPPEYDADGAKELPWVDLSKRVEALISGVEDDGLIE